MRFVDIPTRRCIQEKNDLPGTSNLWPWYYLLPLLRTPLLTLMTAHAHHAWETYNRFGRTAAAAKRAILMTRMFAIGVPASVTNNLSVFQLSYTTLFGIHASYLFLRTGSIWPSITAHMFCNTMGIPEISYELSTFRRWKLGDTFLLLAITTT